MDKAELKNICSRWLWKAFETGTKQDPFSAENSEYWHPAIDLKWSKDMAEAIDEYAQQVSREVAIDFYIYHLNYPIDRMHVSKEFDEWDFKQNQ